MRELLSKVLDGGQVQTACCGALPDGPRGENEAPLVWLQTGGIGSPMMHHLCPSPLLSTGPLFEKWPGINALLHESLQRIHIQSETVIQCLSTVAPGVSESLLNFSAKKHDNATGKSRKKQVDSVLLLALPLISVSARYNTEHDITLATGPWTF